MGQGSAHAGLCMHQSRQEPSAAHLVFHPPPPPAGLPVPVFAAAVPNNWDRNLRQLVADVYEDHQAMRKKAQQAAAAAAEQQQAGEQQGGGGEGGT